MTDGPPAAIAFAGVAKSFGSVQALDDVTFDVSAGEVLGLLGPNGAGKTTLVRIVATLAAPDAGRASVEGLDVVTDARAVRQRIGLAGQLAAVDELLTGRENLRMVGRLYGLASSDADARAAVLLEQFGLGSAANRRVGSYSGGMRRRLDLGATLIGNPSVLLLDEPTSGLDPRSRGELWDAVEAIAAGGTTVLLTSQYLEEVDRLATRVVVLRSGRVLAVGTPDELKSRIGGHVVEVRVAAPSDRVPAACALSTFGPVQRVGQRVAVAVDTAAALPAALDRLAAEGVDPVEVGLRLPSLDDVFFGLTGAPTSGRAPIDGDDVATSPSPGIPMPPVREQPGGGPGGPGGPGGGGVLADVAVMAGRYGRRMLRTPQLLFFATVQPALFVLGLTAVFGGLVARMTGGRYIQFMLPGAIVMNLLFAAGSTGIGLAEDMRAGIIDRFRSLPMARSAVLAGRTIADTARNIGAAAVMVAVAFLLGYRLHTSITAALLAFVVALLFTLGASLLFAALGLAVKDPETAQFAAFAPVLPLIFLSSAWLPIESMTPAVRGFARHQPVNVTIVAVRSVAEGAATWGAVVQSLAWSFALVAVFGAIATRLYRRIT